MNEELPESEQQVRLSGSAQRVESGVEIAVQIGPERVQFAIPFQEGPVTWECLLPFMRALISVASDISAKYIQTQGKSVSCRHGCAFCCRQRVPIAEFEAHRLRRIVESMPEPRRSEIKSRFRDAEERVRRAGVDKPPADGVVLSKEELIAEGKAYFRQMIDCPFLENESCSIYEERPLRCREFQVTSPAEYCADPEATRVDGLPLPIQVGMSTHFLDSSPEQPFSRWVRLDHLLTWTDANSPPPATSTGPELLVRFLSKLLRPKAIVNEQPEDT